MQFDSFRFLLQAVALGMGLSFLSFFSEEARADFENLFKSTTQYGPGVFIQSFEFKKHFLKDSMDEENFFVKKREFQDEKDPDEASKRSPLWWTAGFGYSNLTAGVNDSLMTGTFGLGWEDDSEWSFNFLADIDTIPAEGYRHGAAVFYLGRKFHLGNRETSRGIASVQTQADLDDEEEEYDPNDAIQYYRRKRDENRKTFEKQKNRVIASVPPSLEDEEDADDESSPFSEDYPSLRVRAHIGFGQHLTLGKTMRAGSLKGTAIESQGLNQLWYGPEFEFRPKDQMRYFFSMSFYSYGDQMDNYVSTIDLGVAARQPLVAAGGWSPYANQILNFPKFTVDEVAEWKVNERDHFLLALNQTFFATSSQGYSVITNPYFYRDLNKRWRGGIGAALILSSSDSPLFSASIDLRYKL